jgi:hypothetical protein
MSTDNVGFNAVRAGEESEKQELARLQNELNMDWKAKRIQHRGNPRILAYIDEKVKSA